MDRNMDLKEKIARVAYEIDERKGTPGLEEENWLEAERIVLGSQTVRESSQAAQNLFHSGRKVDRQRRKRARKWRPHNLPEHEKGLSSLWLFQKRTVTNPGFGIATPNGMGK